MMEIFVLFTRHHCTAGTRCWHAA